MTLMIKNTSKNKTLAKESKIYKNMFSKAKGLMFSKKITNKSIIFPFNKEEKWSLHMLFVFFPIDVLWLNKNKEVVDIKQNFKPFSLIAKPKEKASYVIELPNNTIKNTNTEIGDKLSF
ncbi:DUF192 domain-containing protein [Candidatus Woesearchaeota archaeon]|nr:DUF192 domain-containing protein [Candidatus Woesearchaeota archaeon]